MNQIAERIMGEQDYIDENDMLEQGCRRLDLSMVKEALGIGASPNLHTEDGTPVSIVCMTGELVDNRKLIPTRTDILRALLDAGADPNPSWKHGRMDIDGWGGGGGLKTALILFALPGSDFKHWDAELALAPARTWLEAGANPNPSTIIPGSPKSLVKSFVKFLAGEADAVQHQPRLYNETIEAGHRAIALLGEFGCPIDGEFLADIGVADEDHPKIMAMIEDGTLNRKTASAPAISRTSPRL